MAGIKIGPNDIQSVYIGNRMANSVYLGRTLLWTMFVPRVVMFRVNNGRFTYMNGDHSFLSRDSSETPLDIQRSILIIQTLTPVTLNVDFSTYRAGTVIPAGTRIYSNSFSNEITVIFTEARA